MGRDRTYARAWSAAAATLAAGLLAAGLAVAPAATTAEQAGPTYDTGYSVSSAVVAPVYKRVPIHRCTSYRYNATTRVTTCLRWTVGMASVRFLGAVVQQRNASGVWIRIPYSWSRRYAALVYNRWLYLQLHKPPVVVTPPSPAPTSPSSSPPASPTVTTSPTDTSAPTPATTASTLPLPDGTGLSPTPTSTIAGEAAAMSSQYSFMSGTTPATAARWDSCLPITWTVDLANTTKAGTTAADELARWQSAVAVASRITGVTFQYVPGGTGKVTIDQTKGNQVVSTAWSATAAQLVITYVSPTDAGSYKSTAVNGATIGSTGVSWMNYGANYQLISRASVQLEYDWLATASETDHYNLILHEFGHALGLGHVSDTSQVMNPAVSHQDLFRLGDRTGLWQLAQQLCR